MKKIGDRKDGKQIRHLDSFHFLTTHVYPRRTENECFFLETIDLTNMNKFLEGKNLQDNKYKYSLFQFAVAAITKTIILRPRLNYFVAHKKIYHRNYLSTAFVIKKQFNDKAEEGWVNVRFEGKDTFESVHNSIQSRIFCVRKEKTNKENSNLDFTDRVPKPLLSIIISAAKVLDKYGKLPWAVMKDDPDFSSVFITNVGSIGLNAGYHHLSEWGTMSFFCVLGSKKKRPFYKDDGSYEMRDSIDIGLTIDERIADGYYFSKSIKLFKYLFEHPEELDKPFSTKVDYEKLD